MMGLLFLIPEVMIQAWPWKLTPLTARVLGGWFGLIGAGGVLTSRDSRWSAWRIPMQSFTLWAILILVGALRNPQDFAPEGVWNPFSIGMLTSVVGMIVFQVGMEIKRNQISG